MPLPSSAGLPHVAIVTVSYGSEGVLPAFLASVPASTSADVRVVVADNKPDDRIHAIADTFGAEYLPLDSNRGYGGGINAAVATLPHSVQWILISNPDVTLGEGSLDRLLKTGRESTSIGAVGPAILTAEGEIYPSGRAIPSLRSGIGHALFANVWPGNPWSRAYRREGDRFERRRDVGWLSGACLLVRADVFRELGGFDKDFFMYFEDVDLGYRIGKRGYSNVYQPDAVVTHSGAHSTAVDSASMVKAHHDSARLFLSRKYAGPWLAPVRWALNVGLDVRSRMATRDGVR